MVWCGEFGHFLDDTKRRRIRQKKHRSFFKDYLLMSEVTDYYRLRLVVNSLIGLVICSLIYYFGWKRLNFGLGISDPVYGLLVKWFLIFSTTVAFTLNATFRCAILCLLVGALGKNGQAPLTAMIATNLNDGPLENIISNYRLTAEMILCHLQLQAKIVSNRIALFSGPLEEILENSLAKGLKALKKATNLIRRLIAPFLPEIKADRTDEDLIMDKTEQQLAIVSQRKAMGAEEADILTEEEMKNITESRPRWTKFKTKEGRKIAERMSQRCRDIFTKGIDKCRELFGTVQALLYISRSMTKQAVNDISTGQWENSRSMTQQPKKCYDALPILVNYFVCDKFNMESACQDMDRRRQQLGACSDSMRKSSYSQLMEKELRDAVNMTKNIEEEIKVNLHMLAVESPRVELDYSLRDLALLVRASVAYVKSLLTTAKQLIMAVFVYSVYKLFSQCVNMIERYNRDVDFNNCFIGQAFWLIDEYRQRQGKMPLLRFEKSEWKQWKLKKVFSKPTKAEICTVKYTFLIWVLTAAFVTGVIFVDWVIYDFLEQVVSSSESTTKEGARASAEILVLGQGVVAEFMNKMIQINQTTGLDEELSATHCLSHPRPPNWDLYIKWIIFPLLAQLILQVFFSYIVKRLLLNYFLPFMFPRRDQVRLIYLYNKLLFLRLTDRKESRARIRFMAVRWKIMQEDHQGSWLNSTSWFKLAILDRLFKTRQCLLCQSYKRPANLKYCINCPAAFCRFCLEEMKGICYACQAEEGAVTSARTQFLPVGQATGGGFTNHVEKALAVKKQHKEGGL